MGDSLSRSQRRALAQQLATATRTTYDACAQLIGSLNTRGAPVLTQLPQRLAGFVPREEPLCPAHFLEGEIHEVNLCYDPAHKLYRAPATSAATPAASTALLDQVDLGALQSQCTGKKRYSSAQRAETVIAHVWETRGAVVRAYPCQFCGGFHLTHKERYVER